MNIEEMKKYLSEHGVPSDYYTIDGLGMGEIDGIARDGEQWITYYSERGKRRNIKKWETEKEAVKHLVAEVKKLAISIGIWID